MGLVARIERALERSGTRYALLLVALCVYLVVYLGHASLPSAKAEGWWGWWDQAHYLRSAQAFARGVLAPSEHWYPPGYPLLGSFFLPWLPRHPFFILNLLCFVGIVLALYRLFRSVLSRFESVILVGFSLGQPLVVEHLVIPWTTIPTQLVIYAAMLWVVARRPSRRALVIAALAVGSMSWIRPGDLLFVAPFFAAALWDAGSPRRWLPEAALVAAIIAAWLLLALIANKVIFGVFWSTPYTKVVGSIGFGVSALPLNAYSLLVEARTLYAIDTPMLLARYPWTLIALPGVVVLAKRWGVRALGLPAALVVTMLFYLSYRDFDASTAFKFSTVHYLLWMVPPLAFLSYLTVREGWRRLRLRLLLPLAIVPALIAGTVGLRLEDLGVRPHLRFAGKPLDAPVLTDHDHRTYLSATFPAGDNVILEADFEVAQRLRVVQLFGWADNHWTHPGVELDGRWLKPNAEYRPAFGPHGLIIFFKREQSARRVRIKVNSSYRGSLVVTEVRFARPKWSWGGALARWLSASPGSRVSARHLGKGGDHTSPSKMCGTHDGKPDHGIELSLSASVGRRLGALELRTTSGPAGRWTSCGGSFELWRVAIFDASDRAVELSALARGGKFKLYASDNGAFAAGAAFVLVGYDREGFPLFEVPVHGRADRVP